MKHLLLGLKFRYPLCCVIRYSVEHIFKDNCLSAYNRGIIYKKRKDGSIKSIVPCCKIHRNIEPYPKHLYKISKV